MKEAAFGPLFFVDAREAFPSLRLKTIVCTRTAFRASCSARQQRLQSHGETRFAVTRRDTPSPPQKRLQPRRGFPDAPVAAEAAPAKTRDAWSTCCAEGGD
ncbi:hypothetical protein ACM9XA_00680 [Xanthomonas sacchari]